MKFSIIIPCYNEGENLKNLVQRILPLAKQFEIEYLLVENGSRDNSNQIMKEMPEIDGKQIKMVEVPVNKGYGYGLIQGMKAASGDYIGWIHADLQMPPEELIAFMEYAQENGQCGKLFMKGIRTNRKIFDRFFTVGQSVFNTLLFRTRLYDIGAIPVLFHRDLLERFDKIPYDFSLELYVYMMAKKHGYQIWRKSVVLHGREMGTSSWNKGVKSKIYWSKKIIDDSFKMKKGQQVE